MKKRAQNSGHISVNLASMSKVIIHNPHDGFFKHATSDITVARDLLKVHLTPAIKQRIQWNTLKMSNRSFVDEQLAHMSSDMVYTCQIDKRGAYIYVLIEHQSKPDPLLPFRFLQYNVEILKQHIQQLEEKDKNKPLPVIINMCLYSSQRTPYPYSLDIYDCFEDPTLAREELFKPLSLIDLGQITEAELKEHGEAQLMELLLKQGKEKTFLKWIKGRKGEIGELLSKHYGVSGISYILAMESKHTPKEIIDTLKEITPHKEQEIMTAAQYLRQEGRQEGIQQGMHTKSLDIARNMLSYNEPKEKIQQFTGLSEEELAQLKSEKTPQNQH